jgi:hypothetical protein
MKTRANGVLPIEPGDAPVKNGTVILAGDNLWYWIGLGTGWIGKVFTNSTRRAYGQHAPINAV